MAKRFSPRKRQPLERDLEQWCVDHARDAHGWLSRKMNGLGFRSWPDREFLRPPRRLGKRSGLVNQRPLWVEFKRLGKEPTPDQHRLHEKLRAFGQLVYVIDTREDFLKLIASAPD